MYLTSKELKSGHVVFTQTEMSVGDVVVVGAGSFVQAASSTDITSPMVSSPSLSTTAMLRGWPERMANHCRDVIALNQLLIDCCALRAFFFVPPDDVRATMRAWMHPTMLCSLATAVVERCSTPGDRSYEGSQFVMPQYLGSTVEWHERIIRSAETVVNIAHATMDTEACRCGAKRPDAGDDTKRMDSVASYANDMQVRLEVATMRVRRVLQQTTMLTLPTAALPFLLADGIGQE